MRNPKWISWAGLAAIVGGMIALVLTAPFAIAYFAAYPGFDIPPAWIAIVRPVLKPILTFASPKAVYNVYGRVYNVVYVLFLPATVGLHQMYEGACSRPERWGYRLLVIGLLAAIIGNAGDYWANGVGFILTVAGLLILSVGVTVYGVAALRSSLMPAWCAWLLIISGPGVFVGLSLIGHIPSGPSLPLALAWLVIGGVLVFRPTPLSLPAPPASPTPTPSGSSL